MVMEKLLTTQENEFKAKFLNNTEGVPNDQNDYIYTKFNQVLLRSQLDCIDPKTNKTFDLKSRATLPIRLDQNNYSEYRNYELTSLHGRYLSFEREQFDILRNTMLKYYFQAKVGSMDGIFIAYHNVFKIFGFEYMELCDIERILNINNDLFVMCFNGFNFLLTNLTKIYSNQEIRVTIQTKRIVPCELTVYVELLSTVGSSLSSTTKSNNIIGFDNCRNDLNIETIKLKNIHTYKNINQIKITNSKPTHVRKYRITNVKINDEITKFNFEPVEDANVYREYLNVRFNIALFNDSLSHVYPNSSKFNLLNLLKTLK